MKSTLKKWLLMEKSIYICKYVEVARKNKHVVIQDAYAYIGIKISMFLEKNEGRG